MVSISHVVCCVVVVFVNCVNLFPSTGSSSEQTKKTKKSQYSSKSAKRRDRMKTSTVPQSSENDILLLHTALCSLCVVGIKRKEVDTLGFLLSCCLMNIVIRYMNIVSFSST